MEDSTDDTSTLEGFKPSIVQLVLDTHKSLFIEKDDEENHFKMALNAIHKFAEALLFTSGKNRNQFGLFTTNINEPLIPFQTDIAESVRKLENVLSFDTNKLKKDYQRADDLDLAAFLQFCKRKLREVKTTFYKRIIIFITDDDSPIVDPGKKHAALNEAADIPGNEMEFHVVTMSKDFRYEKFYNEFLYLTKRQWEEELCEDEEGLKFKIQSLLMPVLFYRKMLFYPFINDYERYLKIINKKVIQEHNFYKNHAISDAGKTLKKVRKDEGLESTRYLVSKLDGEKVEFDALEYVDIVQNDFPVGYTLLHTSKRFIDVGVMLQKPSYLEVDPSEELKFFEQFWQFCVSRELVLVCAEKLGLNQKVRFVQLIPKYANKRRVFFVQKIPFADEIFERPDLDQRTELPSEEQISITNKLVDKLMFDYDPCIFIDYTIETKKAYLKSRLLGKEMEKIEDPIDAEQFESNIQELVDEYNSLCCTEVAPAKGKRKADTSTNNYARRKKV